MYSDYSLNWERYRSTGHVGPVHLTSLACLYSLSKSDKLCGLQGRPFHGGREWSRNLYNCHFSGEIAILGGIRR